jgi:putative Holliday junction resolvase
MAAAETALRDSVAANPGAVDAKLLLASFLAQRDKASAIEVKHFQQLTRENQIGGWVVGLPLHCDGRDSAKAREVRDFSKWLISTTARPVRFIDERFTTALATRLLRELNLTHKHRKKQLDKIAAHIILDAYLESSKHSSFQPITLENIDDAQISLDDALDA